MRVFSVILAAIMLVVTAIPGSAQSSSSSGRIEVDGVIVPTLQDAFDIVKPGGSIFIGPGTYKMAGILKKKHGVSITGTLPSSRHEGTIFDGVAAGGKAAFVLASNDILLEDITCRNIKVRDRNGACVRFEGKNLTLRNVRFENSENGILGSAGDTGLILIEDSVFIGNGANGRSHGMYINGGELIVRRTQVLGSKDEGHGIKSRALRTTIEDSVIASLEGNDSRLIDIPNGGLVAIRNSLLVEGAKSVNFQLLSFGVEGNLKEKNSFVMENNIIITDREGGSQLILVHKSAPAPIFRSNIVVGYLRYEWPATNYLFDTRAEINFPPAPDLPEWAPLKKK